MELAELWNMWVEKATDMANESCTMFKINSGDHPQMRRMHKADPKAPPHRQDKWPVVPLVTEDFEAIEARPLASAQAKLD